MLASLLRDEGLQVDLLEKVLTRNPVAVHMDAADEFSDEVMPEACVQDVISATIVCTTGAEIVQVAERLLNGYTYLLTCLLTYLRTYLLACLLAYLLRWQSASSRAMHTAAPA